MLVAILVWICVYTFLSIRANLVPSLSNELLYSRAEWLGASLYRVRCSHFNRHRPNVAQIINTFTAARKLKTKNHKYEPMELSSGMCCTNGFVYVACDLAALDSKMVPCLVCKGVGIHWRVAVSINSFMSGRIIYLITRIRQCIIKTTTFWV